MAVSTVGREWWSGGSDAGRGQSSGGPVYEDGLAGMRGEFSRCQGRERKRDKRESWSWWRIWRGSGSV